MTKKSASSRSATRGLTKNSSTSDASTTTLTAEEFDALHDSGADMNAHLDYSRARRPGREVQRVNVDFPVDLLQAIDQEAQRIGVTRQAFIKMRLADAIRPTRSATAYATDEEAREAARRVSAKHRRALERLGR